MSFQSMIYSLLAALAIVMVFVTLNRYIMFKERVALARLGYSLQDQQTHASHRRGNRGVLWGGVITAMSGLALFLGLSTLGIGAWLIAGLLPLFVGLGMLVVYFMTLGHADEKPTSQEPDETQVCVHDNDDIWVAEEDERDSGLSADPGDAS